MKAKSIFNSKSGFTLIEMIGVIAIIAILAAFITPKVFQAIQDSKVTRFAGEINGFKTAVTNWYKDIGTLRSLDAAGVSQNAADISFHTQLITNGGVVAGLWAQWDGPYIDSVNSDFGTLTIRTQNGSGAGAPNATGGNSFDLDDDGTNDMAGRRVVAIRVVGVNTGDALKLDGIIDKGLTVGSRATSGRVKYNGNGTTVTIYLTSL